MHTRIVAASDSALDDALAVLEASMPVAVPTETVYGLAARYDDRVAVERVFEIKGRPQDNPVIVHISKQEDLQGLAQITQGYVKDLMTLWPGPLTLVLKSSVKAPWTTAGLDTIAVRMPRQHFLKSLITRAGPLAAPSANLSGKPSPTTAEHCLQDLQGKLPLIIDGGPTDHGVESTVVDCTQETPIILRPGAITSEDIAEATGITPIRAKASKKSPGTRYRHYAPEAEIIIAKDAQEQAAQLRETGDAMLISTAQAVHEHDIRYRDAADLSRNLYSWLRQADKQGIPRIVIEPVEEDGLGVAIMDRIRKAAKR